MLQELLRTQEYQDNMDSWRADLISCVKLVNAAKAKNEVVPPDVEARVLEIERLHEELRPADEKTWVVKLAREPAHLLSLAARIVDLLPVLCKLAVGGRPKHACSTHSASCLCVAQTRGMG